MEVDVREMFLDRCSVDVDGSRGIFLFKDYSTTLVCNNELNIVPFLLFAKIELTCSSRFRREADVGKWTGDSGRSSC